MPEEKNKNHSDPESAGFQLPEEYFSRSARSLQNRIEWEAEHIPYTLLRKRILTGFIQPGANTLAAEELSDLLMLKKLKESQSPYEIPEKYFQSLSEVITLRLNGDEHFLKTSKENPFTTPADYFDLSARRIHFKLSSTSPARTFHLFRRGAGFAIAAMLIAAIGLWLYKAFNETDSEKDCGKIACVDRLDLVRSQTMENIENDELLELVDPAALQHALEKKEGRTGAGDSVDSASGETIDLLDEI